MIHKTYPHVQAAFINAIREEGTKAEACDTLQALWDERCVQAAELTRLRAKVEAADKLAEVVADIVRHFPDTAQKKLRPALSAYEGENG